MVYKALNNLAADNRALDNFLAVFELNLCIKPTLRLYAEQRAHFAEAVAAALFKTDRIVMRFDLKLDRMRQVALGDKLGQAIVDIKRSAGNAARSRTDQKFYLLPVKRSFHFFPQRGKLLS
jgi:hypothetical protein